MGEHFTCHRLLLCLLVKVCDSVGSLITVFNCCFNCCLYSNRSVDRMRRSVLAWTGAWSAQCRCKPSSDILPSPNTMLAPALSTDREQQQQHFLAPASAKAAHAHHCSICGAVRHTHKGVPAPRTHVHAHTRTHACARMRTHAHTHTRTHAHMHTCTHTHEHAKP